MVTIEKLSINDFKKLNQLLESAKLPLADTNDQTEHFYKALDDAGNIVGAIGLEIYGKSGLLRSLVVEESFRNRGVAKLLINQILNIAEILGLTNIILLTTTADRYFEKQDFVRIHRNDTPFEVKASKEFSSICPVSATVMKRNLLSSKKI